jgi:hypothetical protein
MTITAATIATMATVEAARTITSSSAPYALLPVADALGRVRVEALAVFQEERVVVGKIHAQPAYGVLVEIGAPGASGRAVTRPAHHRCLP